MRNTCKGIKHSISFLFLLWHLLLGICFAFLSIPQKTIRTGAITNVHVQAQVQLNPSTSTLFTVTHNGNVSGSGNGNGIGIVRGARSRTEIGIYSGRGNRNIDFDTWREPDLERSCRTQTQNRARWRRRPPFHLLHSRQEQISHEDMTHKSNSNSNSHSHSSNNANLNDNSEELEISEGTRTQHTSSTCTWTNINSSRPIKNLLVCGDGDLSFSASIAPTLNLLGVQMIATVLEDEETHGDVYQGSAVNKEIIGGSRIGLDMYGSSDVDVDIDVNVDVNGNGNGRRDGHNHKVMFGVDVTVMDELFGNGINNDGKDGNGYYDGPSTFDRIQFNFPHWRGKANHKYNRQLVDAFFNTASCLLSESESESESGGGEIHMALVHGQGGSSAKSMSEYRDTWTPNLYAASHGLLLKDVKPFPFLDAYNLSSHRGVDRGFKIGAEPKMFVFGKPNDSPDSSIPKKHQLCCRHELHVLLPTRTRSDDQEDDGEQICSIQDIIHGDAIQEIIQSIVPDGIRVEIPTRSILDKIDTGYETDMAVFMVVYCGENKAMRRDEADKYRALTELTMEAYVPLRENRKGRLVSKPFPYYLLDYVVEDTSTTGAPNKVNV